MPIVHVNVWEGFGQEKVKTVIQGITKVFADLGIPSHAENMGSIPVEATIDRIIPRFYYV